MPRSLPPDRPGRPAGRRRQPLPLRGRPILLPRLRSLVEERGFSLAETLVASGLVLASLLLVFTMLSHLSLWWTRQQDGLDRTAAARAVLRTVSDHLLMAGYRPSVTGIHEMDADRVSVEYLADGAETREGFSRHRLYAIFRDGDSLKLTTKRRRLPLEGTPAWGEGSTTILAEGVTETCFSYLDAAGRETADPRQVRVVSLAFRLGPPGEGAGGCYYRTAVYLRNHRPAPSS